MKFILGKKIAMTQRFKEDGVVTPVTVLRVGPCVVTQIKTTEKDGYKAVQLGWGEKKKLNKPILGHLKGLDNLRYLREFRVDEQDSAKRGDKITVEIFQPGDSITVVGESKGKGFQGVVKRHGFHGSPASHGHKDQLRMPGSIGATDAARVFKGTRMAGQLGSGQVTIHNLEVIEVDKEKNLLYVGGAVPGARNGLVRVFSAGELKIAAPAQHEQHEQAGKNKEISPKAEVKKNEAKKAELKSGVKTKKDKVEKAKTK